jgi:hypothetical protein
MHILLFLLTYRSLTGEENEINYFLVQFPSRGEVNLDLPLVREDRGGRTSGVSIVATCCIVE